KEQQVAEPRISVRRKLALLRKDLHFLRKYHSEATTSCRTSLVSIRQKIVFPFKQETKPTIKCKHSNLTPISDE
ncbi:hypothetical protein Q6247_26385, partial [Klebsiella pneumoniae]